MRLSGWTLGFVAANQVSLWVVYRLATSHAGDQSAYVNATLFFLLPHGVYAVSVMSALQPDMAERWHVGDLAGFARQVGIGIRSVAAIIVPAAAGLVLLAHPIVEAILRHGHLTSAGADTTAGTLAALAVGLPAFSLYLLLMRTYQAMQDTRSMFLVYLVENGVNIVAALVLYPRFGVQGLGAAFALAYMVGTAVALVDLRRRTDDRIGRGNLPFFGHLAVATAALFVAVAFTVRLLPGDGFGQQLIQVGVGIVVGAFVLLAEAVVLRLDEIVTPVRTVILAIRRRRRRRRGTHSM
jgi:putative peptidoglycan lipid II flippase